jgi:type II secretory pathway component PulF
VGWDLYRAIPRVKEGAALAACWQATPPAYADELRTAEEAGELGKTARHLAARLRFEVEMRRKKIASLLPLAVLLVVGAVIAYRVISFYTNLYSNLPGM